jgi:hypothetical protein
MPPAKKTTRKPTKKTVKKAVKPSGRRKLSASHKKALAEGRSNSAVVDKYLSIVNTPKRRGRKVSKATLETRLAEARARSKTATGVEKVVSAQEVRDLQSKLAQAKTTTGTDIKRLEADFVKIAKRFGENRGIGYGAWRDAGVSAQVLKRAGVARKRG